MERVNCSVSGFCSSLFSGCFVFVGKFAHSRVVMEQRLDLPPRQLRLGHLDTVLVLALATKFIFHWANKLHKVIFFGTGK